MHATVCALCWTKTAGSLMAVVERLESVASVVSAVSAS